MDLARKQSPENLTMPAGFQTNGLAPLTQLPHVADSLFFEIRRKKSRNLSGSSTASWIVARSLLSEHGVGTIATLP